MIRFVCPRCQATLKAPEAKAGAASSCPRCRQALLVPAPFPAAPIPPPPVPDKETRPIICPGCGREIALPVEELGMTIECARCDTRFVTEPAGEATLFPDIPRADTWPDGAPAKRKPWPLIGAVIGACLLVIAACAGIAHLTTNRASDGAGESIHRNRAQDAEAGPWPECADCLREIRENFLNDPDSLQVIKWESRDECAQDVIAGKDDLFRRQGIIRHRGDVSISVRITARTPFGGRKAATICCECRGGRCLRCYDLLDAQPRINWFGPNATR